MTYTEYLTQFVNVALTSKSLTVVVKEAQEGNYEQLVLNARDEFGRGVKLPVINGSKVTLAMTKISEKGLEDVYVTGVRANNTVTLSFKPMTFAPKRLANTKLNLILDEKKYVYSEGVMKSVSYDFKQPVQSEDYRFNEVLRNQANISKIKDETKKTAWLMDQTTILEYGKVKKECNSIAQMQDVLGDTDITQLEGIDFLSFDATKHDNKSEDTEEFRIAVKVSKKAITPLLKGFAMDFYSKTLILSEIFGKSVVDCAISEQQGFNKEKTDYLNSLADSDQRDCRESFNDGVDSRIGWEPRCKNQTTDLDLLFSDTDSTEVKRFVVNGVRIQLPYYVRELPESKMLKECYEMVEHGYLKKKGSTLVYKGEEFILSETVKKLVRDAALENIPENEHANIIAIWDGLKPVMDAVEETDFIPEAVEMQEALAKVAEPKTGTDIEAVLNAELLKLIG
jgi:hypothetical protein